MDTIHFSLIFEGKTDPYLDVATIKKNLAKLFKSNIHQVKRLFSGKPVVIKSNLNQKTAYKYREILKKAGAECRIEPEGAVDPGEPSVVDALQEKMGSVGITFTCDDCGLTKNIKKKYAGKIISCPQCKSDVLVGADVVKDDRPEQKEVQDTSATSVAQAEVAVMSIEGNLAGKGKRFVNLILDIVFYFVFAGMVGFSLGILGLASVLESINDTLLGYILIFSYYLLFETLLGRTVAKFITKTKVVDESGRQPEFMNILGRSLCRFIPFEAFSFLIPDSLGWHDRISKTRVVNA